MKIKTLFSFALILVALSGFSQTYVTQIKSPETKKWGYANQKGEIIITPQFERCYEFGSDGLAQIYDKKLKGFYFINVKGEKLPTKFDVVKLIENTTIRMGLGIEGVVEGFNNGMAAVRTEDKWGYLDTSGKLVIPMKYDDATIFDGGHAVARTGNKYVVLNARGEETPVEGSGILDVNRFSEKLAPYRSATKRFGFIDEKGKVAIEAKFHSVGFFKNGLAWAKTDDALGYINPKGEWVIEPRFDVGKEFDLQSGLARVKKGDKWGYTNRSGEITYVNDTENWGDFSEGLAEGKKGGKRGFFNGKGKWVIEPQFESVRDFKNGFAAAKMNDLWGMIDKEGKWVIKPTFAGIKDMERIK